MDMDDATREILRRLARTPMPTEYHRVANVRLAFGTSDVDVIARELPDIHFTPSDFAEINTFLDEHIFRT